MPAPAHPLPPATRLENYWIQRLLATGGFSRVYLAHDENDVPVAIKEYRIAEDDRGKFLHGMRCFFEEGRALTRFSHPNVVRVLNFFRANDTVYLVMRYERGRTLHEHLAQHRGALDESWIRQTFAQLLNGLREGHTNKLLHLDIKPATIYLRNDGSPLLLDFGAARYALSGEEGAKLPPTYTPGYASPEQIGRGAADPGQRPRRPRRLRAGAQDLGREVFGRAARHRRLVPAAGSSRAAAERAGAAEDPAR